MRQVNSKIYDRNYYLNVCFGSELYKISKGKALDKKLRDFLSLVEIKKGMRVLDLGCGRGDVSFYLAKKGASVVGIDYSKDGIELAKEALSKMPEDIKKLVRFIKQDAKQMDFKENYFDVVVSIDVFEHLYKEELDVVMAKISNILKPSGILLVHTEVNKLYLDYTHKFFVYPISSILLFINNKLSKSDYQGFTKDPRNEYHRQQHVNEPTYYYLRHLFKKFYFKGKIHSIVGVLKPQLSWKDTVYNIVVLLWPVSLFFPLNIFFATTYVCAMRNNKSTGGLLK